MSPTSDFPQFEAFQWTGNNICRDSSKRKRCALSGETPLTPLRSNVNMTSPSSRRKGGQSVKRDVHLKGEDTLQLKHPQCKLSVHIMLHGKISQQKRFLTIHTD